MSASNPFATRFIRPGALEFLFPEGISAEAVVERLRASHWQGQIIGPHGSGKSTLLAALVPALEAAGQRVERYAVRAGEPLAIEPAAIEGWDARTQVVIDGYEQLSWLARRKLRGLVKGQRAGLLVTAHADIGLPTIYTTETNEDLARQIVARLLPADNGRIITDVDIQAAYQAHQPNLREMLFALFDVYQKRNVARPTSRPDTPC